jgi:hypothetical protein
LLPFASANRVDIVLAEAGVASEAGQVRHHHRHATRRTNPLIPRPIGKGVIVVAVTVNTDRAELYNSYRVLVYFGASTTPVEISAR